MLLTTIATGAALASGAAPMPAASVAAPTAAITVNGSCFVNAQPNVGAPVTVNASGFTPFDMIRLSAPGWLTGSEPVSATGTFEATFPGPRLGTADPKSSSYTLTAQDETGGVTAKTSFRVANLAFSTTPATATPPKRVLFTFSGFKPNAQVYGHYALRGKLVATVRFGRARGSCGLSHTRAPLFPGRHPRFGKYKLQFDDSRKYSAKAVPRIVSSLTIRRA